MVKVSVIMAVYNTQQYVGDAIESILNQTYTDFELLICNDGSTDNSPHIIRRYKDCRIRIFNQSNQGVIIARNAMRMQAKGQYLAVMDSDDVSVHNRLEKQVAVLDNNPHVVAVGGQIMRCDGHLNPVKLWTYPTQKAGHMIPHPAHMVRTSVALQVPYRPYFFAAEDKDMFLRLAEKGDIVNIPDTVLYYRWHGNNSRLRLGTVYRATVSEITADMCAVLRHTGRSDVVFDNKDLTQKHGFLLHKTPLTTAEIVQSVWGIAYMVIRRLTLLTARKILRKA